MNDAFQIAATGLDAHRQQVDVIADNLANMATPGFRRGRVAFVDMVDTARTAAPSPDGSTAGTAGAVAARGRGVAVDSVWRVQEPAALRETGSAWDLAIAGEGFLEVQAADGRRLYARGGTLAVGADGRLATSTGHALAVDVRIPDDLRELKIDGQGRVLLRTGRQVQPDEAGQIEIVRFAAPERLRAVGGGLFEAVDAAGPPMAERLRDGGAAVFRQGFLETSNVRLVEEFSALMIAQRGYEASLKVVQAADEMLGMVNNLRRS